MVKITVTIEKVPNTDRHRTQLDVFSDPLPPNPEELEIADGFVTLIASLIVGPNTKILGMDEAGKEFLRRSKAKDN